MNTLVPASRVPLIDGLSAIADRYDAILCDIWGVLHDGRQSFAPASDALVAFRRRGGAVVLITNAPRPNAPISRAGGPLRRLARRLRRDRHLRRRRPSRSSPSARRRPSTTSGRGAIFPCSKRRRPGPARGPFWSASRRRATSCAPACSTTRSRRPTITPSGCSAMAARGLTFDLRQSGSGRSSRRGPDLLRRRARPGLRSARRQDDLRGQAARADLRRRAGGGAARRSSAPLARSRVLAIGDAMRTDIAGAAGQGLDALFVTAGIHREALHGIRTPSCRGENERAAFETRLFARDNLSAGRAGSIAPVLAPSTRRRQVLAPVGAQSAPGLGARCVGMAV